LFYPLASIIHIVLPYPVFLSLFSLFSLFILFSICLFCFVSFCFVFSSSQALSSFRLLRTGRPAKNSSVPIPGLQRAITYFEYKLGADFNFYRDLLPKILSWALPPPTFSSSTSSSTDFAVLRREEESTVEISWKDNRHILANAFLLNVRDIDNRSIDFGAIYWDSGVGAQRVLCLLAYFYFLATQLETPEQEAEHQRNISFHRRLYRPIPRTTPFSLSLPSPPPLRIEEHLGSNRLNVYMENGEKKLSASPSLSPSPSPSSTSTSTSPTTTAVTVHTKRMEETGDDYVFVDFANRDLHIHSVIPSMTQEEVLFSCCPETFFGILISERLLENEVILIGNSIRVSDYTGYLNSFKWTGFFDSPSPSPLPSPSCPPPPPFSASAESKTGTGGENLTAGDQERTEDNENNNDKCQRRRRNKRPLRICNILAIDSGVGSYNQCRAKGIERDILKAYLGFKASIQCFNTSNITTGHW
jgi:hypothetical protein